MADPDDPPIPIVQLSDAPMEDRRPPQQITIGDENSTADSTTWLGFDEATPHHAELGEVEQPALQRDPSSGGPSVPPSPAVSPAPMVEATPPAPPQVESAPEPAPDVAPAPPEDGAPPPPALDPGRTEASKPEEDKEPDPVPAEELDDPTEHIVLPHQDESAPDDIPADDPPSKEDEHLPPPDDQSKPPEETDQPKDPQEQIPENPQDLPPNPAHDQPQQDQVPTEPAHEGSNPTQPSAPQEPVPGGEGTAQGPGTGNSDANGLADDRESDASSIEAFPIKQLGKPLAARGLKIITTKPRLSYHTQIMGWGQDPIVRIAFASDGRVREAMFLQESGNPDIDGPVKDALYMWRAEGKALASLGDPITGNTITVDVRIVK